MKIKDRIINGMIVGVIIVSIGLLVQRCAIHHQTYSTSQGQVHVKKHKQPNP